MAAENAAQVRPAGLDRACRFNEAAAHGRGKRFLRPGDLRPGASLQ